MYALCTDLAAEIQFTAWFELTQQNHSAWIINYSATQAENIIAEIQTTTTTSNVLMYMLRYMENM